jgi:hypothetical protein
MPNFCKEFNFGWIEGISLGNMDVQHENSFLIWCI